MFFSDHSAPLLEAIYAAALDSDRWTDVLGEIAAFVGGVAAGLVTKDTVTGSVCAHYAHGFDPSFVESYVETYWQLDPTGAMPRFDVDEVVAVSNLVAPDEFVESRFYKEWVAPQGWIDSANAVLDKSNGGCLYLTVIRSDANGLVDDLARQRLAELVPHVRRAMRIGRAVETREAEGATFADILDGLSAGLFLLGPGGRITHTNPAARDILLAGDVLWSVKGRLVAGDTQVNQTLRDIFAACERGEGVMGQGIAMPITAEDGEHYVAHVLPLGRSGRRTAQGAIAALFVRRAVLDVLPSAIIGRTYKLTPAELRVLLAIVEVGGVPEVAAAFGVADTTIKTHLGRLYEKTGTGRQADLVKLVAGFSTPLVN